MFRVVFMLGMMLAILIAISVLWVKVIHPFLFEEVIEDKLDDAVEQRVLRETDKKAAEILNGDEEE